MTIQSEYTPDQYTGNGSTTIFAYTFKIITSSNISVIISEIADDTNQDTLILDTDYSVSGVGEDSGGNVTLGDLTSYVGQATLPSTWRVTIQSNAPYTQLTDLENQGAFNADTLENMVDKVTRLAQQNAADIALCPKVSATSGDTGDELIDQINAAVASTAADVVLTNADVVLTNADVVSTNADVVLTNADVVSTNADVVEAAAIVASIDLPTIGAGDVGKMLEVNSAEDGYDLSAKADLGLDYSVEVRAASAIGSVGETSQAMAGHIYEYADLDSVLSNFSTLAYYKFASGALTTDEVGAYTLTNNNAATNTTGILNTNFATALANSSSQYYSHATLLDTAPTNLSICFWVKATDGQPAATRYLLAKTNAVADYLQLYVTSLGTLNFLVRQNLGNASTLTASTVLPNGSTDWYFICLGWDTTNGLSLYVNGVLEATDSSYTTMFNNGTTSDFYLGASDTPNLYWDGDIAQFIVADAVLTQRDVDIMYATLLPEPAAIQGKEYRLTDKINPQGDTSFEYQEDTNVVAKYDDNIYRQGRSYGSTDTVKTIAKVGV